MENEKSLEPKDLINIGIFSALYILAYFATSFLGYIPILMILIPVICPIVAGIPFMLYISKIRKFGMLTITGCIMGLLMLIMGHHWPVLVTGIVCGWLSDIVLGFGKYKNKRTSAVSYGVFSMWSLGAIVALFFTFKTSALESYRAGYGDAYVDALYTLTPNWLFFVLIPGAFIGGLIGAILGLSVLKRHFKRAGII